jgi:hypothetical protein
MGLALVKHFAALGDCDYQVLVVNRGNIYWDDEYSRDISKNPTRFIKLKADRDTDSFTAAVKQAIGLRIVLGVIDFSCRNFKQAYRGASAI